jgi:hypothetical protein
MHGSAEMLMTTGCEPVILQLCGRRFPKRKSSFELETDQLFEAALPTVESGKLSVVRSDRHFSASHHDLNQISIALSKADLHANRRMEVADTKPTCRAIRRSLLLTKRERLHELASKAQFIADLRGFASLAPPRGGDRMVKRRK